MERFRAFFEKYLFNFKGIMVSSLILSAIMFTLILLQPAITNFMIEFYEHVPKRNHEEDVEGGSVVFQKTLKKPTKSTEKILLISKIDSLEKRISKIESESSGTDLAAYRGTFGDMYGSLNSLFSGIGIVGLIVTILLQIIIHKREIEIDKEKIAHEESEQRLKLLNQSQNKIYYLSSLFQKIVDSDVLFIISTLNWLKNNPRDTFTINAFSIPTTSDSLRIVSEKIDQQDMYQAYRVLVGDNIILESFEKIESLLTLKNQIINLVTKLNEFTSNLTKQIDERTVSIFQIIHSNEELIEILFDEKIGKGLSLEEMFSMYRDLDSRLIRLNIEKQNYDSKLLVDLLNFQSLLKLILRDFDSLVLNLNIFKQKIRATITDFEYQHEEFGKIFISMKKNSSNS